MGALTSKPYAFTARPWELRTLKGVDCFDSLGSSIRVDLRGLEIMRVLPRVNEALNEEWITDRVRFSYDALRKQRITMPLTKRNGDKFVKTDWSYTYLTLIRRLFVTGDFHLAKSKNIDLLVGKLVPFNAYYSTLFFIKQIRRLIGTLSKLNVLNFEAVANNKTDVYAYRTNYLLTTLDKLKNSDLLLVFNTNLRLHSPLLNIRVRKAVATNMMKVFNWGVQSDWTYSVVQLGNSTSSLLNLLQGRHPLVRYLLKSAAPFLLYSMFTLRLKSINTMISNFSNRLSSRVRNSTTLYLAQTVSSLMLFDYGILEKSNKTVALNHSKSMDSLWILAEDEICFDSNTYSFITYNGHHGDRNALLAELVLPTPYSLEERSMTINLVGHIQNTELAVSPPILSRTPFSYFNGFFLVLKQVLNVPLSVKSKLNLSNFTLNSLLYLYLGFNDLNKMKGSHKNLNAFIAHDKVFNLLGKIENRVMSSYNISYYADNSVLRSSHVMALSMTRFQRYSSNF
jgi:NADH-quinone oxidoreductase subunit G